ncbi:50S ribosomal protein L6 [bacterium]|nr:50S ribosomal protein L6 [bacterium]
MSRIGNNPIKLPQGVEVKLDNQLITVKGPKGELHQELKEGISLNIEDGQVVLNRASDSKEHRTMHGLCRSLVNNMITGVSEGFKTVQELVGVGYRANVQGQVLELNLGYSHSIFMKVPDEVKVSAEAEKGKAPKVILESFDKQLVGQVAAKIRSLRPPEPYKGKGIKFEGEQLRRKAGKTAAK